MYRMHVYWAIPWLDMFKAYFLQNGILNENIFFNIFDLFSHLESPPVDCLLLFSWKLVKFRLRT